MNSSLVQQLRPHVAEFIGTFALVFVGCGAAAVGKLDALAGAIAFGGTIAVMVYALGHISGGISTRPSRSGWRSGASSPGCGCRPT